MSNLPDRMARPCDLSARPCDLSAGPCDLSAPPTEVCPRSLVCADYTHDVDHCPPKENPKSGFAATSDGGSDGDAGNDCVRNTGDGFSDYVWLKKEPEFTAADGCGDDGGANNDYGHNVGIDADGYCKNVVPKEEPESESATTDGSDDDGGAGEDNACLSGVDSVSNLPKTEPEPKLGSGDGDVDGNRHYVWLKEEPEPEPTAAGEDALADSGRDVGYDCSNCGISLSTREFRVEHELRCKIHMEQKELESQVTKLHHCGYCKCPFLNKGYKKQHQKYCPKRPVATRKDFNGTYFKCEKCEYIAKREIDLKRHHLKHNKDNSKWFTCTQCSFKTVHKHNMTKHTKIHSNAFSCCCSICGKSFRGKTCLDDHLLRRHFDESDKISKLVTSKVYTCKICDQYRTTMKSSYNEHVTAIHREDVGRQKHQCPRCPYSTFSKGNLTVHSKRHEGQKEYQCAVCQKQFTRKTELDSHILHKHTDNVDLVGTVTSKTYTCESCSFKAVYLTALKRHVQSKHS